MNNRLKRFIRYLTVRYLAGQALNGMLANPEWMKCAKDHIDTPGSGDIPHYFATVATRYAHDCLDQIEQLDD